MQSGETEKGKKLTINPNEQPKIIDGGGGVWKNARMVLKRKPGTLSEKNVEGEAAIGLDKRQPGWGRPKKKTMVIEKKKEVDSNEGRGGKREVHRDFDSVPRGRGEGGAISGITGEGGHQQKKDITSRQGEGT